MNKLVKLRSDNESAFIKKSPLFFGDKIVIVGTRIHRIQRIFRILFFEFGVRIWESRDFGRR
ncbi:hypothetical protein K9N08_00045 [Candidatus Gracilibacteria bacterium]|nr:hypothetical protein [Candidatus Gracilibacteria bacterium]MCF7855941.1 hypothetical protein [Candidatus Gracilibacteria bacterium]MCF7896366.1 hypothetical protein [Candidatus Gracilibacteria bacterium]